MVAVNVVPEQNERLPEWRAEGGYDFPIVIGSWILLRESYGSSGTPTNFLLDDQGRIQFKHLGYRPGAERVLEAEIRELLGLDPFEAFRQKPEEGEDSGKETR